MVDGWLKQRSLEEDLEGGLNVTWIVEPDMMMISDHSFQLKLYGENLLCPH
jgi:hypothetical protein